MAIARVEIVRHGRRAADQRVGGVATIARPLSRSA
jgi:hypothetical protein